MYNDIIDVLRRYDCSSDCIWTNKQMGDLFSPTEIAKFISHCYYRTPGTLRYTRGVIVLTSERAIILDCALKNMTIRYQVDVHTLRPRQNIDWMRPVLQIGDNLSLFIWPQVKPNYRGKFYQLITHFQNRDTSKIV